MRTPGRCTNTEGCWISASHRNVWIAVGEDFACPNCGGALSPPLPQSRSFVAAKRIAVMGVAASVGLAVLGLGAVKLSTVSWPGRSVLATAANAPGAGPLAAPDTKSAFSRLAEAPSSGKPLTTFAETRVAGEVARARPNSFTSMILASNGGQRVAARPKGPEVIFPTQDAEQAKAKADQETAQRKAAEVAATQMLAAQVTLVSQASLSPGEQMERPVFLPISFGEPPGPETDREPVTLMWRHHALVNLRRSVFLPAPAAAAPASADAIAQICRIPSLLH